MKNACLSIACVVIYFVVVRWEILGIDLIGPFPVTPQSHKYVCTMTDLFTKWVFARPVSSKSAASVADVLLQLVYSYGPPRKMITDQGREFVNQVCLRCFFLTLVIFCAYRAGCYRELFCMRPSVSTFVTIICASFGVQQVIASADQQRR